MKIKLSSGYYATTDGKLLGYLGEIDSREIIVEGYETEGADLYKIRLSYDDGYQYDVVIENGKAEITASMLRAVGSVKVQVLAVAVDDEIYTYIKKSNIFTAEIKPSINNDNAIPTYEQSVEALEKVIAKESEADEYARRASHAATNAMAFNDAAQQAASSAENFANNADQAKTAAEGFAKTALSAQTAAGNFANDAISARTAAGNYAGTAGAAAESARSDANTAHQARIDAGNAAGAATNAKNDCVEIYQEVSAMARTIDTKLANKVDKTNAKVNDSITINNTKLTEQDLKKLLALI